MKMKFCHHLLLLWNIIEDILSNVGNQTVLVPYNVLIIHTVENNGNQNFLLTSIIQNIFYYVSQRKNVLQVWNYALAGLSL